MGVFVGIVLLVISIAAFYYAIPRGGRVVGFLRNDTVQSLYTTGMLVAFFMGAIFLVAGLSGADPFSSDFQ